MSIPTPEHNEETCLVAVSPAVAELINRVLQEARDAASARGALVLPPLRARYWEDSNTDWPQLICHNGSVDFIRRRQCPESWRGHRYMPWHPSYWEVTETRVDVLGRQWSHETIRCVVDEFGDLIEVPTAMLEHA